LLLELADSNFVFVFVILEFPGHGWGLNQRRSIFGDASRVKSSSGNGLSANFLVAVVHLALKHKSSADKRYQNPENNEFGEESVHL
jgi:hypothetical protein